MNNTPTIAWAKNEQGRFVYLNSSYERQLGVRLEDWRRQNGFRPLAAGRRRNTWRTTRPSSKAEKSWR